MVDPTTSQRLKEILLAGIRNADVHRSWSNPEPLGCQFTPKFRVGSAPATVAYVEDGYDRHLTGFCQRLFDATDNPEDHLERLDEIYAELFTFHVDPRDDQTVQDICNNAVAVLSRLPKRPLGLPGTTNIHKGYFDRDVDHEEDTPYAQSDPDALIWPRLKVALHYSTNVLRLVLFREIHRQEGGAGKEEKQLVDLTADLLHECSKVEARYSGDDQRVLDRWLVVRCFLWASWQRTQMLYFYHVLYFQLPQGIDDGIGDLTVLRSTLVAPNLTIQQFADRIANIGKPAYMCSWAFNLLRTDGIAVGSDFRLFHLRFEQLFGHLKGRCNKNSEDSCDGDQLGNCVRSRMHVEDQSMHDHVCEGHCGKLTWDEESYRSVRGGRAVEASFNDQTDYKQSKLKYVAASERTLAISHAWAHGQGGRPDTGLNLCLHVRYVHFAHQHDCDSYFLDTACIPDEHDLRKEAIKNINKTFRQSKITLIVDKDLLNVDISKLTIQLQESILAGILVSDWNVRAWTLLEAMKGRRNIHVLCRDARSISCRELIQTVAGQGQIDLAILALLAPHLLSRSADPSSLDKDLGMTDPSLEMAGMLLSYRPASRHGDDLTIWSCMINNTDAVAGDAEEFWRHQRGKTVATGFLVSSSERLKTKGLLWAPVAPYAAPRDSSMPQNNMKDPKVVRRFFRAFTGEESEYAGIEERGIFGYWHVHEFKSDIRAYVKRNISTLSLLAGRDDEKSEQAKVHEELNKIQMRYLARSRYRYGAIIQPISTKKRKSWSMHRHIADYSGGVKGHLVVVLGSDKLDPILYQHRKPHTLYNWEWRDVIEWPADVELPRFEEKMLWIS